MIVFWIQFQYLIARYVEILWRIISQLTKYKKEKEIDIENLFYDFMLQPLCIFSSVNIKTHIVSCSEP